MAGISEIGKESVDRFFAGHGTVGTSEAKISSVGLAVRKHIVVRSASSNGAETITVGPYGRAAQGFVLAAGEQTPPIYVENTDLIGVIGSAVGQDFSWIAT